MAPHRPVRAQGHASSTDKPPHPRLSPARVPPRMPHLFPHHPQLPSHNTSTFHRIPSRWRGEAHGLERLIKARMWPRGDAACSVTQSQPTPHPTPRSYLHCGSQDRSSFSAPIVGSWCSRGTWRVTCMDPKHAYCPQQGRLVFFRRSERRLQAKPTLGTFPSPRFLQKGFDL